MKKITTLLFFLVLTIPIAGQSLSFSEAVDNLNNGNKKLKGLEKQAEAAEIGALSVKGLHYPKLTINGSFIHMKEDLYLNANKYKIILNQRFGPLISSLDLPTEVNSVINNIATRDWKFAFQDQNIGRLSIDLEWPIFTGGKIKAGVKAGEIKAEIAQIEVDKVQNILIAELAERYFQTQLVKEAIKVREQALETANEHLYNAKKLEENGMLAPVETMQAQTAVADAERNLKALQKDKELAKVALSGLMGRENENFDLITPLFNVKQFERLEYYQKLAKENYPDILKAKSQKQLAEQNVSVKKGNFIPDIALVGKKYLLTENLPITEPDDWYIGIGLKANVFNGFQTKRNYEQAIAVSESIDLFTEQAKIDIQTLVKKYYTEILKQQEQLESLEESISFSQELVRVRVKAFKAGFATSTDVSDANLYLASIKIKRLQAMFQIDKTLAKLLETCGISNTYINYTL